MNWVVEKGLSNGELICFALGWQASWLQISALPLAHVGTKQGSLTFLFVLEQLPRAKESRGMDSDG